MAYNSDGYIMIDFTEVDFRRTNQTIEGLFKRCVDVIGTNKFILVINANGRTPLPATCSFTNNQYVIDTCIYMFAISSNDNLFIRRNDVPASDIIDDSSISVDKTWSSNKIDSALADYQPLLTPGTNITIDENNVISSTGGAVIDDNVIVNNKVWSSLNTIEKLGPIDTIINNPATFKTSLALPLVECLTSFAATQEGTGDPSPTNVRNIVGVDDITLTVNGSEIVIDLDGARYGGSVDAVNGVAHVTWIKKVITELLPNIGWMWYTPYKQFYNSMYMNNSPAVSSDVAHLKCDKLKPIMIATDRGDNIGNFSGIVNNGLGIAFSAPNVNSLDEAKAWVIDNPITFIYELATPFDIQLTIPQILTISGANSIESNTGNIKVSYKYLPEDLFDKY